MLNNDGDKLNRLEELKRKLFSNNYQTKIEYHDKYANLHKVEIPDSWENKDSSQENLSKNPMKDSIFKKLFIFSIIFFLLALSYVLFGSFFGGNSVSNNNIEISVLGNTFTAGGEELPLQIEIVNKNNTALQLVDLVIEYPNGASQNANASVSNNMERIRTSLGTIEAGSVRNENMKIVLFGEQGSVHDVKISLEYRLEGSNAIFVKDKVYQVTINSTPINLSIDAPSEINPGEDMELKVKTTLNASKSASDMLVKVDYPVGFEFIQATPAPSFGNNVWDLGDMTPGAESNIVILGKMVDVFDGEEKTFQVYTGSQAKNDKAVIGVVFNSLGHTVAIKKPFIAGKLFINGVYQREYATDSKTPIQGQITWTNNLDTNINDLEITAKISGNAFDRKTIKTNTGFYNSAQNIIVWDKNYEEDFASVSPGASGAVNFSVTPLPLYSASVGMLSEPTININISVSGKQLLDGNVVKTVVSSESKIVRIISDVGLGAKALYYSGAFVNTGPIPPKVEKETTYTVVWNLSNTSNNISKAQLKATLPAYMKFVGTIKPNTENLTYNSYNREITWNIGGIPRGTGITNASREVSFQVAFTPSLSQVGQTPVIINEAVLTGHDDFANVDVRASRGVLNTKLSNDATFPSNGAVVIE